MEHDDITIRIDKWLWVARFFKTRSLSAKAVNGGKIHLNGTRVKAARLVKADDVLNIHKGEVEFTVKILAISRFRRPAKEARELYEETPESLSSRIEKSELRKMQYAGQKLPDKKPSKKDRRKIREFKRRD